MVLYEQQIPIDELFSKHIRSILRVFYETSNDHFAERKQVSGDLWTGLYVSRISWCPEKCGRRSKVGWEAASRGTAS